MGECYSNSQALKAQDETFYPQSFSSNRVPGKQLELYKRSFHTANFKLQASVRIVLRTFLRKRIEQQKKFVTFILNGRETAQVNEFISLNFYLRHRFLFA